MQFSLALILAVAGVAVEALPTAAPTVVFMTGTESNSNIEARGLLSGLTDGVGSEPGSSSAPTSVKTYGDDVITTIHNAGTTVDRVGFKWISTN